MTASEPKKKEAREQALKFLQQHKTAALGTVSPDGAPQVAIITCIVDDDFNVYFSTQGDTRKLKNILKEPRVAVTVGGDLKNPSTIQMEGKAEVIDDPQHLMIRYLSHELTVADAPWNPLLVTHAVEYAFVKVTIEWARWLNLDRADITEYPDAYDEEFQEIISRSSKNRTPR